MNDKTEPITPLDKGIYATLTAGDVLALRPGDDPDCPPFYLRPIFDEVIRELGAPPLGFPKQCHFVWPESAPEPAPAPAPRRRRPAAKKAAPRKKAAVE